MEQRRKKCSLKEHSEINSNIYCGECKIYMCNKCENYHSKLFPNHKIFNSDKDINDIFTGYCNEFEHHDKLKYFCRNHKHLCCAACISKIKKEEDGKHKDCDVCLIEEIKDEIKNKIKENIKYLEELSKTVDNSVNLFKEFHLKINEQKEEMKLSIQKIFTKIRNELNRREDKLLSEVDEQFDNNYFKEDLIKKCENLPEKIKSSLDKVKNIDIIDDENNIALFINDCISVEDNIKNIKDINENIEKYKMIKESKENKILFSPDDEESINKFLKNIENFGKVGILSQKEIENPWTSERISNCFYYTLKENNYVAEKTDRDNTIHPIKSKVQLMKNKIYILEFIPTIKYNGDFDIGFGDISKSKSQYWLRANDNVAVTNKGLYINNNIVNNNLKIENEKKYIFKVDLSKKIFSLNIEDINFGDFKFDFENNIFPQAAIRNIGNSIRIKTYEIN